MRTPGRSRGGPTAPPGGSTSGSMKEAPQSGTDREMTRHSRRLPPGDMNVAPDGIRYPPFRVGPVNPFRLRADDDVLTVRYPIFGQFGNIGPPGGIPRWPGDREGSLVPRRMISDLAWRQACLYAGLLLCIVLRL